MAGNVAEWTSTPYEEKQGTRVVRGGHFLGGRVFLTTYSRDYEPLDRKTDTLGFRCLLDPNRK